MTTVDRTRELFADLARRSGVEATTVRSMEDSLFHRYVVDVDRHGDVLEPSLSAVGVGLSTYRFSYGFPSFRQERESVAETIVALAEAVGEAAVTAARRVVIAAGHPCVRLPIVGYAHDGGGSRRFKLYLLFEPGHEADARVLTRKILGGSREPSQPGDLHMLGLDVGDGGLTGAKLYFQHDRLEAPAALAAHCTDGLRRALAIHPVAAPDDTGEGPVAVDLSLPDNDLEWPVVAPSLAQTHPAAVRAMSELADRFPIRVRRISLFGASHKLNVYYVLDEARTGAKPSSGG